MRVYINLFVICTLRLKINLKLALAKAEALSSLLLIQKLIQNKKQQQNLGRTGAMAPMVPLPGCAVIVTAVSLFSNQLK